MKAFLHLAALGLLLVFSGNATTVFGQGLVVNEFSNGPGGNQEYVEYVVVGPPGNPNCGPIDLRGWIVDDNNGDFSCGPRLGVGIAQGHVRFANNLNWAAVPTGSIILIYNSADVNPSITLPDDPTDANLDFVYVVPISSALFDRTSGDNSCPLVAGDQIPMACDAACPASTSSGAYTPVSYASGGSWIQISLANSTDAAQTRLPGGGYFHGVAYGSSTLMNGGPDGLHFAGVGDARVYSLTNGTSTDFRLLANWTRGSVPANETPGVGNNAANIAWIASLQVICPLPVTYSKPLEAIARSEGNLLQWATATEINTDRYEILRSETINGDFLSIGSTPAAQDSDEKREYNFLDANPPAHAYYRLAQIDGSGDIAYSNTVEVSRAIAESLEIKVWPNPAGTILNYEAGGSSLNHVTLFDALGRKVHQEFLGNGTVSASGQIDLSDLEPGIYFLEIADSKGSLRKKIVHTR